MTLIPRLFTFFFLVLLAVAMQAQPLLRLSGTVSDSAGQPLAYASIYLRHSQSGAQFGTTSGEKGEYALELPAATYDATISYLGYARVQERIALSGGNLRRDFRLQEEALVLEEVLITSDGRDPAYGIIQLAIDRKKENRRPFEAYRHQAYTKTLIQWGEGFEPDSLMRMTFGRGKNQEENEETGLPPELASRILFLSENVSEVSVQAPDRVRETILRSRVSGNSEQFSFFGNLFNRFSPYENRTQMGDVAARGLVSPIADNAFFFYDYQLLGTVTDKNHKAYKIRLRPKRLHDPVYQGIIYIADSSYAVTELDLIATKAQQIDLLDTLHIRQDYMRLEGKWVPFQSRTGFAFSFNFIAIRLPFQGFSSSLLSAYDLRPDFGKGAFGREIIGISDSALSYQTGYWDSIRPVPLTLLEQEDYRLKDSLEAVRNSPQYLDSLSRASRQVSFSGLLAGLEFRNYRKKTSLRFSPLLDAVGFNPMEGWVIAPGLEKEWEWKQGRTFSLNPRMRYGFSNQQWSYGLGLDYLHHAKRQESLRLAGGNEVSEFSRFSQIREDLNTLIALSEKVNYLRLYRKRFAEATYGRELLNGLHVSTGLRYERRSALVNTSDFSFSRSNEPYAPNLSVPVHNAFIAEINLRYQPFNRYITTPGNKINLGSAFPLIELHYARALPAGDSSAQFSRMQLSLSKSSTLGLLGVSTWRISAGKFFAKERLFFPDHFHFKGNETRLAFSHADQFFLIPYYAYSTDRPFVEAHWEHSFEGFLLNKVPGIRKLKLREYLGLHYLIRENQRAYLELNAGLEKRILKILPLRVDLNVRLLGNDVGDKWGYKVIVPDGMLGGN